MPQLDGAFFVASGLHELTQAAPKAAVQILMDRISQTVEDVALPKSKSEVAPPESAGASVAAAAIAAGTARIGRLRWSICALLFFATTINYIDRQVIGILSTDLQKAFHWTEIDYGNIVAAFNAAYALGLLVA